MKRVSAFIFFVFFSTHPSLATGDGYCKAVDGSNAEFGYSFGRVPGLALIDANIQAADQSWDTNATEPAIQIAFAQGVIDGHQTIIDFVDSEYTKIIASVRIISAVEGDQYQSVGVMKISGVGVFSMICE